MRPYPLRLLENVTMLNRSWFARPLCVLLCALMSFPAVAAEGTLKSMTKKRQPVDVTLAENGAVFGKLVDRQGNGLAGVTVNVASKNAAYNTQTNAEGFFVAQNVRPGQLAFKVADQTQMIRVWSADTAPPSAAQGALLVAGDTVRGQCCPQEQCAPACGGCGDCNQCCNSGGCLGGGLFGGAGGGSGLLASPLVLGAGVAAAIAIPLALDDDEDGS